MSDIVEHEPHHHHPLKLTDSVATHRESFEYRCDICEELGDVREHSYYCHECNNFIAHIECMFRELQLQVNLILL